MPRRDPIASGPTCCWTRPSSGWLLNEPVAEREETEVDLPAKFAASNWNSLSVATVCGRPVPPWSGVVRVRRRGV